MSSQHAAPDGRTDVGDRPLSDLLSELSDDVTTLMRQEVQLAKLELKAEATKAGKAGGLLGAGAVLGYVSLLLLLWAVSWGLAAVMPTGLAFLIVGLVVGVMAAVLAMLGRKRLQKVDPAPDTTIQTLKEDKQWISEQTR